MLDCRIHLYIFTTRKSSRSIVYRDSRKTRAITQILLKGMHPETRKISRYRQFYNVRQSKQDVTTKRRWFPRATLTCLSHKLQDSFRLQHMALTYSFREQRNSPEPFRPVAGKDRLEITSVEQC